MDQRKTLIILIAFISMLASIATATAIFSEGGPGPYTYQTIRGQAVEIYGQGLYRDMTGDVAIQGIAQDYVTLFIAIPLLIIALIMSLKGSMRWRFLLAGTLNYLFVTYLLYMGIAMYNAMFLAYSALIGLTFFALAITLRSFDLGKMPKQFQSSTPTKFTGWFLMILPVTIALLWLGVVVPPLIDGTIVPVETAHYSTLFVQGMDLGLFHPICFVSGLLIVRKKSLGYLLGTMTLIFLCLLMAALTAKIIAMALAGVNVIPAIFIIPSFLVFSIILAVRMLRTLQRNVTV